MATNIRSISVGGIYIQSGNGIPSHLSPKGSIYIDIDSPSEYLSNGSGTWSVNAGFQLTADQYAAITGSTSPSNSNTFVTFTDLATSTADTKVKVSSFDTTSGYLNQKLTGSTNILLSLLDSGGNEKIQILQTGLATLSGSTFTGPVYGTILSATTISGGTFFGNGSNLTGISTKDTMVTGGTYTTGTGIALFTNNTGGTFNVGGFFKPSDDIHVTGFTINNSTYDLTISGSNSVNYTVNLGTLVSDVTITGGTYNINNGVCTFFNNTGGTFNISGFTTGLTDTTISSFSYNNANKLSINDSTGGTFTVNINTVTGLTITGNAFISGSTLSNTISATTYQNLPTDIRVTGGTYLSGTTIFTNNTGGTFSVTGFNTSNTDITITGITNNNNLITITNNTGGTSSTLFNTITGLTVNGNLSVTGLTLSNTISATTYQNLPTDIRVTGITNNNNLITITNNTGGTSSTLFNTVTGLTITGNAFISGSTEISGNIGLGISPSTEAIYTYSPTSARRITVESGNASQFAGFRAITPNANYFFGINTGVSDFVFFDNTENIRKIIISSGGSATITLNTRLTVTGNTSLQGLTATTISATTYQNLPSTSGLITGITNNNNLITITNNTGGTSSTLFNTVTGLTVTGVVGIGTITTPVSKLEVTETTFVDILTLSRNTGTPQSWGFRVGNNNGSGFGRLGIFDSISGLEMASITSNVYGGRFGLGITNPSEKLHVSGNTIVTGTLSASTISATTYQNLPIDVSVTGGTLTSIGTAVFTNNTGGTFSISGFNTSNTDITITGITNNNNLITITNNTGGTSSTLFNTVTGLTVNGNLNITGLTLSNTISATTYQNLPSTSGLITGITNNNNLITITNNTGGTSSTLFNTVTGLTVNGNLSATTINSVSVVGRTIINSNNVYEGRNSGNTLTFNVDGNGNVNAGVYYGFGGNLTGLNAFQIFSSSTLSQTSVTASTVQDIIIFSGININILTNQASKTLTFSASTATGGGGGGGEVNTASNIGSANNIFAQKSSLDLQFRTLSAGTNVTITSGSTTLTINSTGGNNRIGGSVSTTTIGNTTLSQISGLTSDSTHYINSFVTAKSSGTTAWGIWKRTLAVTTSGTTPTIRFINADVDSFSSNLSATTVNFSVSGTNININVSGVTNTQIQWDSAYEIISKSTRI